jgi:hypothetical protein
LTQVAQGGDGLLSISAVSGFGTGLEVAEFTGFDAVVQRLWVLERNPSWAGAVAVVRGPVGAPEITVSGRLCGGTCRRTRYGVVHFFVSSCESHWLRFEST